MTTDPNRPKSPTGREPDFEGPGWKNPYVIYILLTAVLFLALVIIAWVAWTSGWIPSRGIGNQ